MIKELIDRFRNREIGYEMLVTELRTYSNACFAAGFVTGIIITVLLRYVD